MTELDKDNFDQTVLASKGVYLVDFWSETCETCLDMMPQIETLARDLEGRVGFGKVNIQGNRRLAIREKVLGLPNISIYKDGVKVTSFSQTFTADQVKTAVQELIGA
jgi:thioredoxin 1